MNNVVLGLSELQAQMADLIQFAQLQDEVASLQQQESDLRTHLENLQQRADELQEENDELRRSIGVFEEERRRWTEDW